MRYLFPILLSAAIFTVALAVEAEPVTVCYTENGYEYRVPPKKKLVVVPWWWNVKKIVMLHNNVQGTSVAAPKYEEDDDDCLVFGPGGCN